VGLAALTLIAIFVTRKLHSFVTRLQESQEDLRLRGVALNSAEVNTERITLELSQFIDTVPGATIGVDADGLINEWNPTAAKVNGYIKEAVLGEDLVHRFIAEGYRAPVKAIMDDLLQGIDATNYEFPLYTKDGDRIEVLLNATTRRDLNGNINEATGVAVNITDAKDAKVALHQAKKMEVVATEKILVVDDEPRVRKTAARILRKLGYEVIEADSGEEALVSIKKNQDIDLMFSDILMPGGMNGRQLASIVNTEYPKIKIQLTTGDENVEVTMNGADADFPLLKKPYDLQDLATALQKSLD
jgi:PAS domain S-box-containing protein